MLDYRHKKWYTINSMSDLIVLVVSFTLVILIIFCAIGGIVGGKSGAHKVVAWELKWLSKIVRGILKFLLQTTADVCKWAHKKL